MRVTTWMAAVVVVALAGCSYAYRNPAEALGPGEVGGRTVAGVEVLIDGVAVSVQGAALDATSRKNGRFTMLPLPVGKHTLMFRKGKERALQRDVEIAYGADGQPQGLWLGDVQVPAAVSISGECAAADGASLSQNGIAVDEVSGAIVPINGGSTGDFLFEGLSVGTHRIRVYVNGQDGTPYVGGPVEVTLLPAEAGTQKRMARFSLHRASTAPADTGLVKLRFSVAGSSAGLRLGDLRVTGLEGVVGFASDGTAQVDLREGVYTVGIELPASVTNVTPPPRKTFVAIQGKTLDLGTLYAVTDSAQDQAALSCRSDADCAPGTCTASHVCTGYTPPAQAPASVPYCGVVAAGCTPGLPVGATLPHTATCAATADPALRVGVPCGGCCTPDGIDTLCGDPGVGGCPGPVPPLVLSPTSGASDTGCVLPGVTFTASGGTPPYAWSADVQGLSVSTDTTTATWNICDTSVALGTYTITVHDSGTVVQTRTATASVVSTSGPLQVSTSPVAGSGGIPADTLISTTFDRPLAPATVNAAAMDVLADGVAVLGSVSLDAAGTTLTFTPAAALPAGAYVEVWINTSLTDSSGYPVQTRRRWVFSVAAPVVIPLAISPARTVLQGNCRTGDTTTFTASGGTPPYSWTTTDPWPSNLRPSLDPSVSSAVWNPCESAEGGFTITVTDALGATQSADGIIDWPPQLTSTIPAMGDGVQVTTPISATFNKRLDPATVNSASVQVSFGTGPLAGTVALDAAGTTITFTPDAPLPAVQVYQATVFTAVTDLLGTPLSNDAWWVFSTVAPGPAVASTSPVNNTTWVPYDDAISVVFSEPMDPATVNPATFYVQDALGAPVAGTVSAAGTTASFTPAAQLCNPCSFTATVTTGVLSGIGAPLTSARTWSFSTGKAPAQAPARLGAAGIHTLAIKVDQSTWAWGTNTAGALGNGGTDGAVALAPVQAQGLPAVQSVDGAAWYSLALSVDGTVWGWGWGPSIGVTQSRLLPAPIAGLTGVSAFSAGYRHGLAVRTDGGVMGWGFEDPGVIDPPIGSYAARQLPGLTDIVAVAAGERFSLALRSDGVVLAWGNGGLGQLGNGGAASSGTPARVPGLTGVVAIAAESFTGLALRNDYTLWGWGHNAEGEAGVGSTAATQLVPGPIMGGVAAVATGNFHALALLQDGTVRSWGYNLNGRLGDGTTTHRNAPVVVAGLSGVAEVSCGEFHSAARKIDGTIWTWGYNGSAQLGDGTQTESWVPVQVPAFNLNTP